MTLSANTVWEVRTTGAQTNGGGFVTGASGTDYSQQAAAQYALNAVAAAGASAVMTHASAAADMVGNICRVVSGTNATAGWYQIISVNVGVNITVDRNWCTGACANGVVNVGGAFKIGGVLDDDFTEAMVAGNTVYVKSGTYTLGEAIQQAVNATSTNPFRWFGYKDIRNDECHLDDRPLFVCDANRFELGDYTLFYNMRGTSSFADGLNVGTAGVTYNCKWQNTGVGQGFSLNTTSRLILCDAKSNGGFAVKAFGTGAVILSCFVHDSVVGIVIDDPTANDTEIKNCIIDTCTIGIDCKIYIHTRCFNNTIYACTTGIAGTDCSSSTFTDNIIANCTVGASWTTTKGKNNFWDHNCWSNNGTDVVNVTKGPHDVTANAKLKDPANDDFTLKGGSPCFATGLSLSSDVGLP